MNSVKTNKCHVLGRVNYCEDNVDPFDDLCLFTPQEIANMDFTQMMDLDDTVPEVNSQGIQAEDLSSLLEQFEATESTDEIVTESSEENILKSGNDSDTENQNPEMSVSSENHLSAKSGESSPVVPSKVLDKIRAGKANKRKATIMLPLGIPSKKGRGPPTELPISGGSMKLQRIIKQNSATKSDQQLVSEQTVQDVAIDHDYCSSPSISNTPTPARSPTSDDHVQIENFNVDHEQVVHTEGLSNCVNESLSSLGSVNDSIDMTVSVSQESKDSGVEEGEIIDSDHNISVEESIENPAKETVFFPCPRNLKSKRNYRKREEPMVPDASKFYDKIPAYFTTLSLPQKPPKKEKSVGGSGITIEDYIPRDRSPTREMDTLYSKLPDYYSCFTNSTRYDGQEEEVAEIQIKTEPMDEFDNEYDKRPSSRPSSRRTSRSRSYSSSSSSSSSYSSCSRSHSRSSSPGRSRDRYRRSRRRRRRHSYSSSSRSSSRSRSSCYSSSRSRSRSKTRPRQYRSRSRARSYRSRSRHHSRRRHRSYSRSRSRDRSTERIKLARKKRKEEEKERQIRERRIVYVGRIPDSYTKRDLKKRFDRFGEIENVSTHFREAGDNYGFVTFAYTCDAYAAIEKGNAVPGELQFELCFGGRRQFCDTEYADLDGKADDEDMFQPMQPKAPVSDFDELLRQALKKKK
ncbi:hypothetical protein SNE40_012843 [Patella caerulea]|uniref:RRM domain-containing protein n=1 Tax=Patella caerulea TaxID=87958 RepID=A0AAN8JL14_PATCE